MMKKALILLLIFVFCLSSAYAEDNVWVEESWRQIDREVDCDEIQLKIHAKVQEVPEGMEVCRYFLDNPSYDFLIAAVTHRKEDGGSLTEVSRHIRLTGIRSVIPDGICPQYVNLGWNNAILSTRAIFSPGVYIFMRRMILQSRASAEKQSGCMLRPLHVNAGVSWAR